MEPRPKGQTLKFINGYPIAEGAQPVDPLNRTTRWNGRVQDLGPTPPFAVHIVANAADSRKENTSAAPADLASSVAGRSGRVPKWITYDRKVLAFGAYFEEDVPYSAIETWRVRKVTVRYYLENDQLEIVEAREVNSGLPQGVLLKRHRTGKEDGSPLHWSDLRVGGPLVLYRRTYHLVSADAFTRAFYSEQGQEQPPDEPYPEGPYDQHKKALEASRIRKPAQPPPFSPGPLLVSDDAPKPITSPRGPATLFKVVLPKPPPEIVARDTAVLRFLAAWDNTAALFGDVLPFALSYHVEDGTVEVHEVNRRNSGRDPFPLLLRRGRLPKVLPPVHGRPMTPETRRSLNIPYYDWRDLYLGATINVYGRQLLLFDCDEATLAWLKKWVPELTAEQLTPIQVDFDPYGAKRPPLIIPPNSSGIGSEEDSLQNVLRLVPRAVPRSHAHYVEKGNKVLRFSAVMVPLGPGRPLVGPHDGERRFIMSFHLVDGTLGVFEPRQVNSGMEQGTFLERTRVPNPATGQPYGEADMQVGAVLEVFGRGFQLLDSDNYSLSYLEQQCYRFPWADYDQVLSKLATWLAMYVEQLPDRLMADLVAADTQGSGYITKYQLYDVLTKLGCDVSPHEVTTVVRRLGADRQGLVVDQLLAALGLAAPPPTPQEPVDQVSVDPPQPAAPSVPFPAPGLRAGAWPRFQKVAWGPDPVASQGKAGGGGGGGPAGPAAAAGLPYRGLGPTPGYPRADGGSTHRGYGSYYEPQPSAPPGVAWSAGDEKFSRQSSLLSEAAGGDAAGSRGGGGISGDDRQPGRDTQEKSWRGPQNGAAGGPFGSSWTVAAATNGGAANPQAPPSAATPGGYGGGGAGGSSTHRQAGGGTFLTTGLKQPSSLWQTTNMSWGGVGHAASYSRR